MKIRSLEVANFRRFRAPLKLDGFTDGLNVVVEPNETGKSTLLEALRAALFIRHSAQTELTRSYCPLGDDVGPNVAVAFEINGESWAVEKQFLRSKRVSLTGPRGRFESDAAEDQLQRLLGFERGNNKGTDPDTRGSLGLLWVEQASALSVTAPNRLVRDNVRASLEGEVGAITGGKRFEAVRARVEDAYGELRTGKQGRSTGRLLAAEERARVARERRETLATLARAHDATLTELGTARAAKRRVEAELADEEQARLRNKLADDLKLGESAAERLATATARFEIANAEVERLVERIAGIDAAEKAVTSADDAYRVAADAVAEHDPERQAAVKHEADLRQRLTQAQEARTSADKAVRSAREALHRQDRAAAITRAQDRLASLDGLEKELVGQELVAGQGIEPKELEKVAKLDKAVVEARAVVAAGAVRVEITSRDGTLIRVDGKQVESGGREVTSPTIIDVGEHASLCVIPAGAGSAVAELTAAKNALAVGLSQHGVATYADAVARASAAKAANDSVKATQRQIETLCVADALIGLASGPAALRAFLSTAEAEAAGDSDAGDLSGAEAELTRLSEAERVASGQHSAAITDLRAVDETARTLGITLAGAERDLENARAQLKALTQPKGKAELDVNLDEARRVLAERLRDRDAAAQAVSGFDVSHLKLRIANFDKATASAGDTRLGLVEKIAGLEATVASEGAKGLAGQADAAREEEAAANQALARLAAEADTLELLRSTLREAQDAASRTFLGPVTKRAVRYVQRILPDCDLTFGEELGLTSIVRGGISEGCGDLSRGTQEQLAVLTRLAFADLLLEKGEPVSLILDDPLVYSDDARLEIMTDILTSAAERMQVILLTCRERAFRHLGGNRITIV